MRLMNANVAFPVASAVTSELSVLAGVTDVHIDLVVDGTSTVRVTADQELSDDEVALALDEAGDYKLASK